MAKRRSITSYLAELPQESDSTLSLEEISLPASQPRHYFDSQKMSQLVASVEKYGILEPLLVRPKGSKYELVAGERRYRAAKKVGLVEIPVIIRELDDTEALAISLMENLQREDLNPVEETEGILNLISIDLDISKQEAISQLYKIRNESRGSDNVVTNHNYDKIRSVFSSLGLLSWDSFITHRLPLLKLPEEILEVLGQGKIAYTKALAISRLKDKEQRQNLLKEAIVENLSIRQIKERIAELKSPSIEQPALQKQIDSAYRNLKKSKVWHDPKRRKRLEKLLKEMESLIES
ncbi:MAG: ParB/RepB/Spo0J family partition protein [Spirulinaceae cyanobacterium]